MLSWLLNPHENHGFGDRILKGFIQFVETTTSDDTAVLNSMLMDCNDFVIQREWHNIDIVFVSQKEKYVVCIENKIDSTEHNQQLFRYRRQIEDFYPDFRKKSLSLA